MEMSINRLNEYLVEVGQSTGDDTDTTLRAANDFFRTITGCRTDAVYVQLCKMVIAIVRSQSSKGTEKMAINTFKVMLEREFKAQGGVL